MKNIFIKVEELPRCLKEQYFNNEDLISLEDLIATLEDVSYELNDLKDEYEEFKEDVEQNYKYIDERERIGYDERTW